MKENNIDAEKLLNEMISDFIATPSSNPSRAKECKLMLFGAIKFAVKVKIIKKAIGEKMQKRLEEICEKKKGEQLCQE